MFQEQAVVAPGLDTSGPGSSSLMPAEVPASPGTPAAEYTNPVETAALDTATSLPDGPEEAGPLLLVVQNETSGSASLTPAEVPTSPDTPAISPLSLRCNQVFKERKRAREAQELQAQKMVKRSRRVLTEAKVGDNVTVPIPNVDRGRTDPKNLIGVIVERDSQELYKIATKSGVLDGKFSRNQFDICGYALYSIEDMDMQTTLPLRKAVQEVSTCGGQGFVRCNCHGTRCQTKRCKCFKSQLKCNSRCHSKLPCNNKA